MHWDNVSASILSPTLWLLCADFFQLVEAGLFRPHSKLCPVCFIPPLPPQLLIQAKTNHVYTGHTRDCSCWKIYILEQKINKLLEKFSICGGKRSWCSILTWNIKSFYLHRCCLTFWGPPTVCCFCWKMCDTVFELQFQILSICKPAQFYHGKNCYHPVESFSASPTCLAFSLASRALSNINLYHTQTAVYLIHHDIKRLVWLQLMVRF